MNIKQKRQIGILIAILVIGGLSLWLITNSGRTHTDEFEGIVDSLNSCEKVASSYVGISESQASDKAKKENREYRVVNRDGEGFSITGDYVPGRLNFEVQKGFVTKVTCG